MIKVGKPINGISVNGLEYILKETGEVEEFESMEVAEKYLISCGCCEEDLDFYVFEELEDENDKIDKWILVDVDSMKFVRKESKFVYSVKEPIKEKLNHIKSEHETGCVSHGYIADWNIETYDFTKIPVSELYSYVKGFYISPQIVFNWYGDNALRIFAECAFENEMEV